MNMNQFNMYFLISAFTIGILGFMVGRQVRKVSDEGKTPKMEEVN